MGGFRLLLENFIKYGFRVDPMQWLIVLTGQDEGKDSYFAYPSLILVICKAKMILQSCFDDYVITFFILDSSVPIAICFLIERGLSAVSFLHNFHITESSIFVILVDNNRTSWSFCPCCEPFSPCPHPNDNNSRAWSIFQFIWSNDSLLHVFHSLHETMELRSSQHLVSPSSKTKKEFQL